MNVFASMSMKTTKSQQNQRLDKFLISLTIYIRQSNIVSFSFFLLSFLKSIQRFRSKINKKYSSFTTFGHVYISLEQFTHRSTWQKQANRSSLIYIRITRGVVDQHVSSTQSIFDSIEVFFLSQSETFIVQQMDTEQEEKCQRKKIWISIVEICLLNIFQSNWINIWWLSNAYQ